MVWRFLSTSLALLVLTVFLVVSLPWMALKSTKRMAYAIRHLGETPVEGRARIFGPAYTDAIEEIRRAIPKDAAYLLVDAGGKTGSAYWVRFDLAPRRPILLGTPEQIRREGTRKGLSSGHPWIVIAPPPGQPPILLEPSRFLEELPGEASG
jgi:hypothetical protein